MFSDFQMHNIGVPQIVPFFGVGKDDCPQGAAVYLAVFSHDARTELRHDRPVSGAVFAQDVVYHRVGIDHEGTKLAQLAQDGALAAGDIARHADQELTVVGHGLVKRET